MSGNIQLSMEDANAFVHNLNHPSPEVVEARKRFLTEEHKIDYDAIFRNCERFKVKVAKGEGLHGVTMNGKEFDVTEVIDSALEPIENDKVSKYFIVQNAQRVSRFSRFLSVHSRIKQIFDFAKKLKRK